MQAKDPLIGQNLGDYLIQDVLGQGGMARVYKGYDAILDRYAAVKVIEPNLVASEDQEEYRDRFLREARAIARLNHPRVVGVYQFNQAGSLYYMAMVFVEGTDLRQILKQHNARGTKMSFAEILRIMTDIAEALDYAHEQQVIHRDVKPSNIMVTRSGNAVLTDFGLALTTQEGTLGNTFGSVHYIAPEQAVSSAQAVAQSDLYSLGAVLYEILTGQVPFEDVSAMSVALKHISEPPPPPSTINAGISPQVEEVVMKMLEKDPAKRFKDGKSFIQALSKALSPHLNTVEDRVAAAAGVSNSASTGSEVVSGERTQSNSNRLEDLPTISESSGSKPGSIPVAPLEERRNRRVLAAILALLFVVAIVVGGLFIAGIIPPDDGSVSLVADAEATADQALAAVGDATEETTPADLELTDEPSATRDEVVATETSVAASMTPSVTPSASPSHTASATATVTVTPTPRVEFTATPLIDGAVDDPQLLLMYDGRTLVVYNRAPTQRINIRNLSFVQENDDVTASFEAREWLEHSPSANLVSVRSGACFQVIRRPFASPPTESFANDLCVNSTQAWLQVRDNFWINADGTVTFDVRRAGQTLGTCPTVSRDASDPVRCVVDVRNRETE